MTIKAEGVLGENTYKILYPTGVGPKFYGLSTVHKRDTPLDPQYQAGVQAHMKSPGNYPTSLDHW